MRTRKLRTDPLEKRELLAADLFGSAPVTHEFDTHFVSSILGNLGTSQPHFDLNLDGVVSRIDALQAMDDRGNTYYGNDGDSDPQLFAFDDHVNELGSEATQITLEGSHGSYFGHASGILELAGDVDVFQFESTTDAQLNIHSLPLSLSTTRIQIFDINETLIAEADSIDIHLPAHLDTNITAGSYYLVVSAGDNHSTGEYLVDLSLISPGSGGSDPVDDHANQIGMNATAIPWNSGGGLQFGFADGILEESGDIDVFQFSVDKSGPLHFMMLPPGLASTRITLVDSNHVTIGSIESNSIHEPIELTAELSSGGTYYVVVEAADGVTTGDYFFDLQFGIPDDVDPPLDDHVDQIGVDATELFADAGANVLMGDGVGTLEDSHDVDVFQFTLVGTANLSFFGLPHSLVGASYSLMDSAGVELFQFGDDLPVEQTLNSGTYYVAVGGGTEPYMPFHFFVAGEYVSQGRYAGATMRVLV